MANLLLILFTICGLSMTSWAACEDDLVRERHLAPHFYKPAPADPITRNKSDLYKLALVLEDAGMLLPQNFVVLPERMSSLGMFRLGETRNTRGVFLRPRDVEELRNSSPPFYFRERQEKIILMRREPPGYEDIPIYEFELGPFRNVGLINATIDARPLFTRYFAAFQVFDERFYLYSLQNFYTEKSFSLRTYALWRRWREFTDNQMRLLVRTDRLEQEVSVLPGSEGQPIVRPIFVVDPKAR